MLAVGFPLRSGAQATRKAKRYELWPNNYLPHPIKLNFDRLIIEDEFLRGPTFSTMDFFKSEDDASGE
jgi:hypothetical protein